MQKTKTSLKTLSLSLTLGCILACSSTSKLKEKERPELPIEEGIENLVIVGINDFHGALSPMVKTAVGTAGSSPVSYEVGGAAMLASYIKVLKSEFGERLLILDAGDAFQGTLDSNNSEGASVVEFYNALGVKAAAIGNHEFDFSIDALKKRISEANYPYVSANIFSKATGKRENFGKSPASVILNVGRVKVGVIGLTTLETPFTTRPDFVKDLEFRNLKEAALLESETLRKNGADIIVGVAHAGLVCGDARPNTRATFWHEGDGQPPCEDDGEIVQLLRGLPKGSVDAVVSGHSHTLVHHWVDGVPVLQGGARGHFFNVLYLNYDTKGKRLLKDTSTIEGPVPVCPRFFENQRNCNGDEALPRNGRGRLMEPTFHGISLYPDREMERVLEPLFEKTKSARTRVIGKTNKAVPHFREAESPMGNLVADAIRWKAKADFGMINGGGIRAPWNAGDITYQDLFTTFPFENSITVLDVTGKELKSILRIAESGAKGLFPVSGMSLRLTGMEHEFAGQDWNGDGKIEPWEFDRVHEIKTSDGKAIDDDKTYKLATSDFLVLGGDLMQFAMSKISDSKKTSGVGLIRGAIEEYIAHLGGSLTVEQFYDLAHPRMSFEKPKAPKATKRARRKRR